MGKKLIGLTDWIRDINNSWAEQFDLRRHQDHGWALVALGTKGSSIDVLITEADVENMFEEQGLQNYGDKDLRGSLVLMLVLRMLSEAMACNEFVRLDSILGEAVATYCRFPSADMSNSEAVEPFQDIA